MQAMDACIAGNVRGSETLVVAYSGGLDSTVLLHAACQTLEGSTIRLSAIHVNHGLSPNADTWASFCTDFCRLIDVPLRVCRVNLAMNTGEGIEGEARRLRLNELSRHSPDWILLAHHADDQAETLLHNLLRGAGVRGAAAIPGRREKFLRPFLRIGRGMLKDYADAEGLRWIDDESNQDLKYTRNYLRAKVLPILRARYPSASEQLAAAAERFGEANQLLNDLALVDLADTPAEFPLPIGILIELPESRARNLLRALLAWQGVQAPDEVRLKEFLRQLRTVGNDKRPSLSLATYSLWCEKRQLHFQRSA
jgi:tRNA(Ile)-lysidine synthase